MYIIQFRRGTTSDWALKNTILRAGEPGHEIDTDRYKIGDGQTRWLDLPYYETAVVTRAAIEEAIEDLVLEGGGISPATFERHVESLTPHPVYDDGPSLTLLYENAKV